MPVGHSENSGALWSLTQCGVRSAEALCMLQHSAPQYNVYTSVLYVQMGNGLAASEFNIWNYGELLAPDRLCLIKSLPNWI